MGISWVHSKQQPLFLLRSSFLTAAQTDASIKSEGKADNRL